jgi:peptidoglycan/xylan/chitin deacetylase (PgdA/CDA1 family)
VTVAAAALRGRLKTIGERTLGSGPMLACARLAVRGQLLVLAYHNVVADDTAPRGDRSLHLPLSRFLAHLDLLASDYEVVPLGEVDPTRSREARGRPRVAITFDDAYRGAVSLALPALAQRGLPATVFVAPGLLGRATTWWDALASEDTTLDPALRDTALRECRGDEAAVREWAAEIGLPLGAMDPVRGIADEGELLASLRLPGITVGSHTWSHPNLAALDTEEADMELRRTDAWLRARVDRPLPWLAFPYGLAGTSARMAARALGYRGALCVVGGWMPRRGADPYAIPRLNVPAALSAHGFAIRLAGLLAG